MATRKPVTIHYRRFSDNALIKGLSLEDGVRSAMAIQENGIRLADRYSLRIFENGDDNLFANVYHDGLDSGDSLVFGDILHFTKGHLQALFDAGQRDVASASVEQMRAPERKEYIHSIMYWMIKDDHVFVIQSTSLRTEALENYLGWLLSTKTQVAPTPSSIVLASQFDGAAVGGDLNDIQELIIGGVATPPPIEAKDHPPAAQPVTDTEVKGKIDTAATTGWQQAREILSTLLGGSANVDKIMDAVPEGADLSVEVHIGYKTRKRAVSREGLKSLETGLRNLPDSQLQVRARDGVKTADGSIRLHHPASIQFHEVQDGDEKRPGSLLDPTDVLRAMKEAHAVFVANGKIGEEI